ncbi:MAG: HYR domain-containing protein [Flavobacteriales bacterium]|nr:HYR domain-containing protein [Flavobacteriales bacterium]
MPINSRQIHAIGRGAILVLFLVLSGHVLVAQSYTWAWAQGINGNNEDVVTGVANDNASGAIYAAGYTKSSGAITGTAGTVSGGQDAFLIKYTTSGSLAWSFTPSGNGTSQATGIAVDANGNSYVTGWYKNSIDLHGLSATGSGVLIGNGDLNWFIASYASDGTLRWCSQVGGPNDDTPSSIAVSNDAVYVLGTIKGRITTPYGSVSNSLPTGKYNLVLVKYSLNGSGQWLVSGGSNDDESAHSVATDEDQVYVAFRTKNTDHKWYGPSGNTLVSSSALDNWDLRVSAFTATGSHSWIVAVNESEDSYAGPASLATGCGAVYLTSSTHAPTSFPGVGNVNTGTHDLFFLGRLSRANGQFEWVTTGTTTADTHTIGGRDIAIGQNGIIHVSGTYKNDLTIGNQTVTSTSSKLQPYVASFRPTSACIGIAGLVSSRDAAGVCITADQQGDIALGGYYQQNLSVGAASLSGAPDDPNGFVLKSSFSAPAAYDQTVWTAPATMCSNSASLNLNSLLTPYQSGGAIGYTSYSSVSSPAGAQGMVTGSYATFNSVGSYVTMDLGVTVPAGGIIRMLWKSAGGAATATVLAGTIDPPTNAQSSFTTSSTSDVYSTIQLTNAARYLRLTRASGSSTFYVDGVYYEFGNDLSGTWSGTGVTGNTFNPTGLSGPMDITYTVGTAPCATATTNSINVQAAPVGGTISSSVVGPHCPGNNSGTLTLSGYSGDVLAWISSTDGFVTSTTITNTTNTLSFANLTMTRQYRVRVGVTNCGTAISTTYTVLVNDNVPPVITTCPPAQTIVVGTTCQASIPDLIPNAVGTDNCSTSLVWSQSPAVGTVVSKGTHVVIVKASDAAGNTTSCNVTITAVDNTAPVMSGCPTNVTLNAAPGQCSATYNFATPTATDNCGAVLSTSVITNVDGTAGSGPGLGNVYRVGVTTRTFTFTDQSGNASTCSFTITVVDNQNPTVTNCLTSFSTPTDLGSCGANVSYSVPVFSDNCLFRVDRTQGPASGDFFPVGTTQVTYVATDSSSRTMSCTFNVTVQDLQAPLISGCPSNISIQAPLASTGTTVNWIAPNVADNCGVVSLVQTTGQAPGSFFTVGDHTIDYLATDVNGNSSVCTFTVTVISNDAPTITCPSNEVLYSTAASCSLMFTYATPLVSDDQSLPAGQPVQIDGSGYTSGSGFPLGTTVQLWRVTDSDANSTTCSFTVQVIDTIKPTFTNCPNSVVLNSDADQCGAVHNYGFPAATDNCAGPIVRVRTAGLASGSLFPVGTTLVRFRATDSSGNFSICTFTVTVVDNQAPTLTDCPTDMNVSADANTCGALVTFDSPTFSDNCTVTLSQTGPVSGSVFPIGDTPVQFIATDAAGHTATCSINVHVEDTSSPTFTYCPGTITATSDIGSCGAIVNYTPPEASDNCTLVLSVPPAVSSGSFFPVGTTMVTYTASDGINPTVECSFTVEVSDNQDPAIIDMPNNIDVTTDPNGCGATVTWVEPTANDNCSAALVADHVSGDVFPIGSTVVTYTADDGSNTTSESFLITVTDLEIPSISCSIDVELIMDATYCNVLMPVAMAIATGNCSIDSIWQTSGPIAGDTLVMPGSPYTIGWSAVDINGNVNSCTHSITVLDVDPPTISSSLYDNIEYFLDANCQLAFPDLRDSVTVSDCSTWTNNMLPLAGTIFTQDTVIQMTMEINDLHGNQIDHDILVWIRDSIAPVITCPSTVNVIAPPGDCTAIATFNATAIDNCGGSVSIAYSHAPGSVFNIASTTVTATATIGVLTATCDFQVNVIPATVDLVYDVATICTNAFAISPITASPIGGVFSDATQAGTIDPTTGLFDPSNATPGLHPLRYEFISGGCAVQESFIIEVISSPDPGTNGTLSICASSSDVSLFDHLGGSPQAGGSWSGPSVVINGRYDPATMIPGDYLYTVSGTAPCGDQSAMVSVTEIANPVTPTITGPTFFCAGSSITLTSSSVTGNVWSPGNETTQSITVNAAGTYSVTVTTNGCSTTSADKVITERPLPNTPTISGPNTFCTGSSTMLTSSSVLGNSWNQFGETSQTFTVWASGIYYVVVTANECQARSADFEVTEIPTTSNTTTVSECDSYTWSVDGQAYTTSGTYSNTVGCHTEVLELTITPSTSSTTTITACDTYTWSIDGQAYTTSGTYTNTVGCHTEILELTIVPSTGNTTTITACDTYTWALMDRLTLPVAPIPTPLDAIPRSLN